MPPYLNANLPTSRHTLPNATASLGSQFTNANAAVLPINDEWDMKLYPLLNFAGNVEECPLFIANYRDTSAIFRYSNHQNLMRLPIALQGEARLAVDIRCVDISKKCAGRY